MHKLIFILSLGVLLYSCDNNASKTTNTLPKADSNVQTKLSVDDINNPRTPSTNDLGELGILTFTDTLHDFGTIKEGDVVTYDFEYTNTGKSGCIITEARASCGCTVPEFSQDIIKPGQKGAITVKFNSDGKKGENYKNVTVRSNANPGEQNIAIKAKVQ